MPHTPREVLAKLKRAGFLMKSVRPGRILSFDIRLAE